MIITTQRISPASAGGGFYLTKQSEYNLRLFGQRFYESPLLVKSRALKKHEELIKECVEAAMEYFNISEM